MDKIGDYTRLSAAALAIKGIYANPKEFLENYRTIEENEKKSYLRHYIINNSPYAFRANPILFEQIVQYLADKLGLPTSDVKLIGSAKTGFSISKDNYGRIYNPVGRDLDFSVINQTLFLDLENEFKSWKQLYLNDEIVPKNETEKQYWNDNVKGVAVQLQNGFIDTYKIPNYDKFLNAKKISNALYLIARNLERDYSIIPTKASIRVYSNWETFIKQLKRNTDLILKSQ